MSKLTVQDVANIWYERFIQTEMSVDEHLELLTMCAENEIEVMEVENQIHMDLLKDEDILDLVLELKEKYENDIIKANETNEMSLVDDFLEECFVREIHPMDVLLLVEFELKIKEDK